MIRLKHILTEQSESDSIDITEMTSALDDMMSSTFVNNMENARRQDLIDILREYQSAYSDAPAYPIHQRQIRPHLVRAIRMYAEARREMQSDYNPRQAQLLIKTGAELHDLKKLAQLSQALADPGSLSAEQLQDSQRFTDALVEYYIDMAELFNDFPKPDAQL